MEIVVGYSNKGSPNVCVAGYKYVKLRELKTEISWRCSVRCCSSSVRANLTMDEITKHPTDHSCLGKKEAAEILAGNRIVETINSNLMSKPAQIINKIHGSVSTAVSLPSDKQLKERINYNKRKLFGGQSSSERNNLLKVADSTKTIDGDKFIIYKAEDESMLIFGTSENVRRLMDNPSWMGDGTFSLAPLEYQQLFILSAKINGI